MPRQFSRSRRVAQLIQHELAPLLHLKMDDIPNALITISMIDVSPDLKNAKVFVTSLGIESDTEKVIHTLNENAWYFRRELAQVLSLRSVPKLKFLFDHSIERGSRLTALIDSLVEVKSKK